MHGPYNLRRLSDTGVVTVGKVRALVSTLCSARDRVARKTKLSQKKKKKKTLAPDT